MIKKLILSVFLLVGILYSNISYSQQLSVLTNYRRTTGFEVETVNYLNAGISAGYGLPNEASKIKIDGFIKTLKAGGDYAELDLLYLYRNNGDHNFACLNVKDPANFKCIENGTPTYTQDGGFDGNASSMYLNTQWVPSTNASKYTLNSASAFFYVYDNVTENNRIFGAANTGNTNRIECIVSGTTNQLTALLNSSTVASFDQIWTVTGFYHLKKTSSTNIDIYRNGLLIGSVSVTNTALPNVAMYALARNAAGTASGFSANKLGILGFGSSSISPTNLYQAWLDYSGLNPPASYRRISTSIDGITWTRQNVVDNGWKDVTYSPSLGLFCAVAEKANGTNNRVATSPDGITWTVRAAGGDRQWIGVEWAPSLNLFCAVALSGTNRVMTSPDGITWTDRTTIDTQLWVHIAWSPSLSLFVAVSETSGTNGIMTSPDGINWTQRTTPTTVSLRGICWSPELAIFCVSAFSGEMLTSPDGINWTNRTSAEANQWTAVAWSPSLNLFAACSNTGAHRVQTSPDGITWTIRNAANNSRATRCLTWSTRLGLFLAGADNLTTGSIETSPDGITWTTRNGGFLAFNGIIEGGSIVVAVAIGDN